jgi:hypothetical protein
MNDTEHLPWCSTKVDREGNHVTPGGFWGHCDQDCFQHLNESLKLELSTNIGMTHL